MSIKNIDNSVWLSFSMARCTQPHSAWASDSSCCLHKCTYINTLTSVDCNMLTVSQPITSSNSNKKLSYLSEQLRYIADMPARTRLRSSSTSLLDVHPSRRVTVGDRSFATADPRSQDLEHSASWCYFCNIAVVISSKTEDTLISAVISWHCCVTCAIVDLAVFYFGHYK